MFSQGQKNEAFVASGDLSGCLGRIVDQLATDYIVGLGAVNGNAVGVLANAPKDKEHAAVATDGIVMVRVGAAVTAGQFLTAAASGWAVNVTSGAGQSLIGRARTGAASGMLAAVDISPFYRVNSAGN